MNLLKNMKSPSPKWFRVTKKIVSWTTNVTLAILVVYIPEDAKAMIIAKIAQSSLMELFDLILAEVQNEGGGDAGA